MPPARSAALSGGMALALLSAAAFGTNVVSAQLAAAAGIGAPLIVFYRVFVMLALVLAAALWARHHLAVAPGQRRAVLVFGLASALVGTAYLSSVAFLPVTVAAVVFYTFPVLIVLAEPLVTGTRFSPDRLLVALTAFLGVALVVGPDLHGLDPRGLALALAASLLATTQFFAAASASATPALPKLFWVHVIALPVTALILLATGGQAPAALLLAPWAVTITISGYLAGFVLQILALQRVAPGPAGLAFCAEPLFAVALAALVLGERVGPLQHAGGALVIAAIVTNVILEQKRNRAASRP